MKKIVRTLIILMLSLFIHSLLSFGDDKNTPLKVEEVKKLSGLSEDAFRSTLFKHGIQFTLTDDVVKEFKKARISEKRIAFIKKEILPIVFIPEKIGHNSIYYSISNRGDREVRITQIEAKLLSLRARAIMKEMPRIRTKGIIFPYEQTKLFANDKVISLKPYEMDSFSTSLHITRHYIFFSGLFQFKISFLKNDDDQMRYCFSDKIYYFSPYKPLFVSPSSSGKIPKSQVIYLTVFTGSELLNLFRENFFDKWKSGSLNFPGMVYEALEELGKFPNTILQKALKSKSTKGRHIAAKMIVDYSSSSAVSSLINALKSSDIDVRKYSALALGNIGGKEALEGLLRSIEDKHNEVRKCAIMALGKIGDQTIIPKLLKCLEDNNLEVRKEAKNAINRIWKK